MDARISLFVGFAFFLLDTIASNATTAKSVFKKGACPTSGIRKLCWEQCSHDFMCKDDQKCCPNGCGHLCVKSEPVQFDYIPDDRIKGGFCPFSQNGNCERSCDDDYECDGQLKCCFNGCGHTCEHPVVHNPLFQTKSSKNSSFSGFHQKIAVNNEMKNNPSMRAGSSQFHPSSHHQERFVNDNIQRTNNPSLIPASSSFRPSSQQQERFANDNIQRTNNPSMIPASPSFHPSSHQQERFVNDNIQRTNNPFMVPASSSFHQSSQQQERFANDNIQRTNNPSMVPASSSFRPSSQQQERFANDNIQRSNNPSMIPDSSSFHPSSHQQERFVNDNIQKTNNPSMIPVSSPFYPSNHYQEHFAKDNIQMKSNPAMIPVTSSSSSAFHPPNSKLQVSGNGFPPLSNQKLTAYSNNYARSSSPKSPIPPPIYDSKDSTKWTNGQQISFINVPLLEFRANTAAIEGSRIKNPEIQKTQTHQEPKIIPEPENYSFCPPPQNIGGNCTNSCSQDTDCKGKLECCFNGCAKLCIDKSGKKPGLCPNMRTTESCANNCSSDFDCPGDQKCCSNGCGFQCLSPKYEEAKLRPSCSYANCPKLDISKECRLNNYNIESSTGEICEDCPVNRCIYPPCPNIHSCKPVPKGCAKITFKTQNMLTCTACPENVCSRQTNHQSTWPSAPTQGQPFDLNTNKKNNNNINNNINNKNINAWTGNRQELLRGQSGQSLAPGNSQFKIPGNAFHSGQQRPQQQNHVKPYFLQNNNNPNADNYNQNFGRHAVNQNSGFPQNNNFGQKFQLTNNGPNQGQNAPNVQSPNVPNVQSQNVPNVQSQKDFEIQISQRQVLPFWNNLQHNADLERKMVEANIIGTNMDITPNVKQDNHTKNQIKIKSNNNNNRTVSGKRPNINGPMSQNNSPSPTVKNVPRTDAGMRANVINKENLPRRMRDRRRRRNNRRGQQRGQQTFCLLGRCKLGGQRNLRQRLNNAGP